MSAPREFVDYLHDIVDAADNAAEFTRGMDAATFASDTKTVFAVIRALEIVGEATKRIPSAVRDRYAALPWREMAGMRDRLAHDYSGVNLDVVWRTVQNDLPGIRSQLRAIIAELEQE